MLIVFHGNGYTLDQDETRFTAVAIRDGRIVDIGSDHDILDKFRHLSTRIFDACGATILPGFVDSHMHICGVASRLMELDLTSATSGRDMLAKISAHATSLAPGAWIRGGGFDEHRFPDHRLPTLSELDSASHGHPLFLSRVCSHAFFANSTALTLAGIEKTTPDPAGGAIGRDADGQPNGLLYDNTAALLWHLIPEYSEEEWLTALVSALYHCASQGLTEIHSDDLRYLGQPSRAWSLLREAVSRIPLRLHELVAFEALASFPFPDTYPLLSTGAVKWFADGAFGGRTAFLAEPYADAPESRGILIDSAEDLARRVQAVRKHRLPVAIHTIGDAALDAALTALEQHPLPDSAPMPDRLVHYSLCSEELIARTAELRVVLDVQPRFIASDFPWLIDRLGPDRCRLAYPLRRLLASGLSLCGGSDAPIEPVSPLLGIHAAITRRNPDAEDPHKGYVPEEALTMREAILMYTGGAKARGAEEEKGIVKPGAAADFTLLSRDPFTFDHPDRLLDTRVTATIVDGIVIYES